MPSHAVTGLMGHFRPSYPITAVSPALTRVQSSTRAECIAKALEEKGSMLSTG